MHPDLVTEVHTMIPAPDLAPLEEKLHYLKRNIYKALPSTRLESKTDSMAYNRVSLHLTTFKRACFCCCHCYCCYNIVLV